MQFASAREILWSLTPSLLMVLLALTCCTLVYGHFRAKQHSAIAPLAPQGAETVVEAPKATQAAEI